MGTCRGVCSRSIGDPPRPVSRSVTFDPSSIKRYAVRSDALVDAPDESSSHANPPPRRGVAQAPAHGRRPAPGLGLDPAGDPGDDGALPVAGAGNSIVPRRGHSGPRRPDRGHDRGAGPGALSQGAGRRVPGGRARLPGDPLPAGPLPGEPPLGREAARHAGWAQARVGPHPGDRLSRYAGGPAGPKLWETTATRLRAAETRPRAAGGRHRVSLPPHGSTWVTRPRPHIDRIASAWLIRRFYDPEAKFAFADAADAARKGVPFDVLGADFGHHGEDCTFETLVKRFGIKDRRVKVIAEIVHEADLHDDKFTRNEAPGVDLAINGLVEATPDDHELLERGMAIFDGLYTVLKQKT